MKNKYFQILKRLKILFKITIKWNINFCNVKNNNIFIVDNLENLYIFRLFNCDIKDKKISKTDGKKHIKNY